jgi:transposase
MTASGEVFVGIDTAKARNAIAVAEGGREGELRYLGEFDNTPDAVAKLIRKLAGRYATLHICYEAGPTGYGLYRQVLALGHDCVVVAPSLIPRRPGDRVKTNRRDALSLARLLRAGELTAVWVPDETHEAVRDLVRTRAMAVEDYRRKRQHVTSFLLRHGRSYDGKTSWRGRHKRWLDAQNFPHPAQRLAFQEMLNAVQERWPWKFGQIDKWKICLRAARMPRNRRYHDETRTPDPHTRFQGQGGIGCHQRREDAIRFSAAV